MSLKQQLHDKLQSYGFFTDSTLPKAVEAVKNSIPDILIEDKMRLLVAISEITLFASHMRRNIYIEDTESSIPVNMLSFILAGSGSGKDRTVSVARKAFSEAYDIIEQKREDQAIEIAKKLASANGSDAPYDPGEYTPYLPHRDSLFANGSSTVKGLHGHFNSLDNLGVGAGSVYDMEIGSSLKSSKTFDETIKFIAECFDSGDYTQKVIGAKDEQLEPLSGFPVNITFGGSPVNILFDLQVRNKFNVEFGSKLSRRTVFYYLQSIPQIDTSLSLDERAEYKHTKNIEASNSRAFAREGLKNIALHYLYNSDNNDLTIDPEAYKVYQWYLDYNTILSEELDQFKFPLATLSRANRHWLALKLAGAIAITELSESILPNHLASAANIIEQFSDDLHRFEVDLNKEPYEMCSEYIQSRATDDSFTLPIHDIRKLGYIKSNNSKAALNELVLNMSSYDSMGIYTANEKTISYERIVPTPINGLSYLAVSGTKDQRARQCHNGFQYTEIEFPHLRKMLMGDFAYTPFEFKDGKRSKANIISGCKWLALDVDHTTIPAENMHELLLDINHHIALTSDSTNDLKYRVLLELDSFVNLNDHEWNKFIKSIAEDLYLSIDTVPRSQIFFSYANSEDTIWSKLDAKPLPVKSHLLIAKQAAAKAEPKLTKKERDDMLADKFETFSKAYECPIGSGTGNRVLVWAIYKAKELEMNKAEIVELINDINAYWVSPMSQSRIDTILRMADND